MMSETLPATPEPQTPQLDYAPKPPLHRRRLFRRSVIVLVIAVLLMPVAWLARTSRERATLLYWQRQCESFSLPAGSVAYDENPATVAGLWASVGSSGNFTQIIDGRTRVPLVVLMRPRGQWETSIRQRSGGLNQFGAVFLHARRAPGASAERIVCVHPYAPLTYRGSLPAAMGPTTPDFSVEVLSPATLFSDGGRLSQRDVNVAGLFAQPFGTVRILAGQIDPADESHFTIDFQTPSGSGTIDGRLRADDSVTLTLRQPTTTVGTAASTTTSAPAR
jgi:hypothetical protein